jgi:hypothetical protein
MSVRYLKNCQFGNTQDKYVLRTILKGVLSSLILGGMVHQ